MVSYAKLHEICWGERPICRETYSFVRPSGCRGRTKKRAGESFTFVESPSSHYTYYLESKGCNLFLKRVRQWSRRPGFNTRWSHTKDSKMVLDASLLNTQHDKVRIKGKMSNPEKGVASSPTPQCSSYWKGDLRTALDYGRPTNYCIYLYIYSSYICSPFLYFTLHHNSTWLTKIAPFVYYYNYIYS